MMQLDISALRQNYALETLEEQGTHDNPFVQFHRWFEAARQSQIKEPNAMTLATADAQGRPSARTVLLKGMDERGFVFYTNYGSRKGQELQVNPQAALLFTWLDLERQIRIEGRIEKVPTEESRAYFQSRPKSSQIGAWASPQSRRIPDRSLIEAEVAALSERYAHAEVLPLPPHWGGYVLRPDWFEFWQGRESRLHDRIAYRLENGVWTKTRLAP
jgi:pyridoxamine 5'-phosphate oxidase